MKKTKIIAILRLLTIRERFCSLKFGKYLTYSLTNHIGDTVCLDNKILYPGETLSGEILVEQNYAGKIFVTKPKIRHYRSTKNFAQ